MELRQLGMAFSAAMGVTRHDARLRAQEKRLARERARHFRGTRKGGAPMTWGQRIDASIDPVIFCAACLMLGWLLHKWS